MHAELSEVQRRSEFRVGALNVTGRYHRAPKKMEDDYTLTEKVFGRGYNGDVVSAISIVDEQTYAVKRFKLVGVSKERKTDVSREVEIFLRLDHPHIVRLVDVYESRDYLSLVMECMEGGEVLTRLTTEERLSEFCCADIAWQMILAINYLHTNRVVHRDLKLQNLLYEKEGSNFVKLIDFGFSKIWKPNEKMAVACGTMSYVAPEVLREDYTSQCDLWSFGVCIFALLFGYLPFKAVDKTEQMENILAGRYLVKEHLWSRVSEAARDFVSKLLVVNPKARLTAEQAMAHSWIAERQSLSQEWSADIADSLLNFSQAATFRRATLSIMAWSLTTDQQEDVRAVFLELDKDNGGTITLGEFKHLMEERFHFSGEEATLAFKAIDLHHDEEIQYNEFLAAMLSYRIALHDDLLLASFRRFDIDGSGFITQKELHEMLKDHFQEGEVEQIMHEADLSGDGMLDYQEWIDYLRNGNPPEPIMSATARHIDKKLREQGMLRKYPLRALTVILRSISDRSVELRRSCCAVS